MLKHVTKPVSFTGELDSWDKTTTRRICVIEELFPHMIIFLDESGEFMTAAKATHATATYEITHEPRGWERVVFSTLVSRLKDILDEAIEKRERFLINFRERNQKLDEMMAIIRRPASPATEA